MNYSVKVSAAARSATLVIGEIDGDSVLLPVSIRGEVPGRAMRGSATLPNEGQAS